MVLTVLYRHRELHIKIFETNDLLKVTSLNGHKKGVRAITWDPSGSILVRVFDSGFLSTILTSLYLSRCLRAKRAL